MLKKLSRNFRWQRTADRYGPRRMLVLELGLEQDKATVISRTGKTVSWEDASTFLWGQSTDVDAIAERLQAILKEKVDRELQYVSLVIEGDMGMVRLLNFPGNPPAEKELLKQVRQTMGVDDSFSVRYGLVPNRFNEDKNDVEESAETKSAGDYAVLAAAMQKNHVESLQNAVFESGMTLVSLLPAGIVTANLADAQLESGKERETALGFLAVGAYTSLLLLYNQGKLTLARQFKTGFRSLVEAVMNAFDLDDNTAKEVLNSGSFDLSEKISSSVNNWLHQIGISLDFIERRFGRRVEKIFLNSPNGGGKVLIDIIGGTVDSQIVPWNEFTALQSMHKTSTSIKNEEYYVFAHALGEGMRIMKRGLKNGI